MDADLKSRRRALQVVYRRYLRADAEWAEACETLDLWFPEMRDPKTVAIGNPGSRIRQLHDRRDRALLHLNIAMRKLKTAQHRLAQRRQRTPQVVLRLRAP